MKKNYLLFKAKNQMVCYINYKQSGYKFKPQNKVYYEGITVNELVIINPSFVTKVLKKKIKHKLDYYLKLVIAIIEGADDDDGVIDIVLDDLERYKRLVQNNYRKYLDDKYIELLLTKISLLENELQSKKVYQPLVESRKR